MNSRALPVVLIIVVAAAGTGAAGVFDPPDGGVRYRRPGVTDTRKGHFEVVYGCFEGRGGIAFEAVNIGISGVFVDCREQ